MKTTLLLSLLACSAIAAAEIPLQPAPKSIDDSSKPLVVFASAPEWSFAKGEFSADSYYTARFSGDFDNAQQGVGFGVGYSITKNIVAQVRGVSYNDEPNLVNEIIGRLTLRAQFLSPKLAVYGFGEGGGNLQSGGGFAGAGGGLEWRPWVKNIGVFAESDLRLSTEWVASIGVSGGLRLSF